MKKIKNSKKGIVLFIAYIVFILTSGYGYAQSNNTDQQIIDTLKKFYIDYNTAWSTDTGYTLQKRIYLLRKKICTPKLLKPMGNNLDYDLLINNNPTDIAYLNTLTIRKDSTKADTYIVSYIAHGFSFRNKQGEYKIPETIHVKVVKEKEVYKIDSAR